jgi:hypothetical protein
LFLLKNVHQQPIVLGNLRRSRGGCKGFLLTYSRRSCTGRKNQWEAGMRFGVGVDTGGTIEERMSTVDEEEVPENCREEENNYGEKTALMFK